MSIEGVGVYPWGEHLAYRRGIYSMYVYRFSTYVPDLYCNCDVRRKKFATLAARCQRISEVLTAVCRRRLNDMLCDLLCRLYVSAKS